MQGRLQSRLILLLFFFNESTTQRYVDRGRHHESLSLWNIFWLAPTLCQFQRPNRLHYAANQTKQIVYKQTNRLHYGYVHVRGFGFQNPGNICLWNPDSIIQLKESGILLEIGIQNPNPTDKDWNPVPGIQNSRLSWILSHRAKHNLSFNSDLPHLLTFSY